MTGMQGGPRIFHLTPAVEWQREAGGTGPVALDQLERHGFVHCCTREQITEIARWWFADEAPLVVIEARFAEAGDVRFESADQGRLYPHVYNAIPRAAVVGAHELPPSLDLPAPLADPPPTFRVFGAFAGNEVVVHWNSAGPDHLDSDHPDLLTAVDERVAKGEPVPQFPGVNVDPSVATAYDAFCVLAAVLDEVVDYAGDGFELGAKEAGR